MDQSIHYSTNIVGISSVKDVIDNNQWKTQFKKKLNKNHDNSIQSVNITNIKMENNFKLNNVYILWHHDPANTNWDINSYNKLCTLETINDFWSVFNFFSQLGYRENNYYLMKNDTEPTWEHINNRNGGACSIRTTIDDAPIIYQDLCIRMMCDILNSDMYDINGVSCCPKNSWAIIKIWNKDKNKDLTKTMNSEISTIYKSIGMRYKSNEPEY